MGINSTFCNSNCNCNLILKEINFYFKNSFFEFFLFFEILFVFGNFLGFEFFREFLNFDKFKIFEQNYNKFKITKIGKFILDNRSIRNHFLKNKNKILILENINININNNSIDDSISRVSRISNININNNIDNELNNSIN